MEEDEKDNSDIEDNEIFHFAFKKSHSNYSTLQALNPYEIISLFDLLNYKFSKINDDPELFLNELKEFVQKTKNIHIAPLKEATHHNFILLLLKFAFDPESLQMNLLDQNLIENLQILSLKALKHLTNFYDSGFTESLLETDIINNLVLQVHTLCHKEKIASSVLALIHNLIITDSFEQSISLNQDFTPFLSQFPPHLFLDLLLILGNKRKAQLRIFWIIIKYSHKKWNEDSFFQILSIIANIIYTYVPNDQLPPLGQNFEIIKNQSTNNFPKSSDQFETLLKEKPKSETAFNLKVPQTRFQLNQDEDVPISLPKIDMVKQYSFFALASLLANNPNHCKLFAEFCFKSSEELQLIFFRLVDNILTLSEYTSDSPDSNQDSIDLPTQQAALVQAALQFLIQLYWLPESYFGYFESPTFGIISLVDMNKLVRLIQYPQENISYDTLLICKKLCQKPEYNSLLYNTDLYPYLIHSFYYLGFKAQELCAYILSYLINKFEDKREALLHQHVMDIFIHFLDDEDFDLLCEIFTSFRFLLPYGEIYDEDNNEINLSPFISNISRIQELLDSDDDDISKLVSAFLNDLQYLELKK